MNTQTRFRTNTYSAITRMFFNIEKFGENISVNAHNNDKSFQYFYPFPNKRWDLKQLQKATICM